MPQQASTQGGPQTASQLEAARAQRDELNSQLQSLTDRRADLIAQSRIAGDGPSAREVQSQLASLDKETARLNTEISRLNTQISAAVGRGVGVRQGGGDAVVSPMAPIRIPQINIPPFAFGQRPGIPIPVFAGALIGEAVVFVIVGIVFWQLGWRRVQRLFAHGLGGNDARIQQLQQSVDVIGVEVERISEGQRFVAKLLNDVSASPVPVIPREKH
jgi:cell division protein FtsB